MSRRHKHSDPIRLVRGDTRPNLLLSVYDSLTNNPIDLSDAGTTALFKFRKVGSTEVKSVMTCTKLEGYLNENGEVVVTGDYGTPGKGGRLRVDWEAEALDEAGEFEAELEVTFADGSIQTPFETIRFRIRPDF